MGNNWISKDDELPSAYEEVEILMVNGSTLKDMIVRGQNNGLEWKHSIAKNVIA